MRQSNLENMPDDKAERILDRHEKLSQKYPAIKLWQGYRLHVVPSPYDDGDWDVWLNTEAADFDGLCIGTGQTRAFAVQDAINVLEQTVQILRQDPAHNKFQVQSSGGGLVTPSGLLEWNDEIEILGTGRQGMLSEDEWPWTFEETVARLITLSGQDPFKRGDRYKQSITFYGTFNGRVFDLYDYKEDAIIHIGGFSNLEVEGLRASLRIALAVVQPTPYEAKLYYTGSDRYHSWPAKSRE